MGGRLGIAGTVAAAVLLTLAALGVTAARAETTHVFDATLSLVGNCQTYKTDPVIDPSCPAEPPGRAFDEPLGVTTDAYGDIYYWGRTEYGASDTMYIFDADGHFIDEVPIQNVLPLSGDGTNGIAVDAEGNLYVGTTLVEEVEGHTHRNQVLFVLTPSAYNPEAGEIAYGNAPTAVAATTGEVEASKPTVEAGTGHVLFSSKRYLSNTQVFELGSYAEGNPLIRSFGEGDIAYPGGNIAVDPAGDRIYVGDKGYIVSSVGGYGLIRVFDLAGNLVETMTGAQTVEGFHEFESTKLGIAVDESTGHLFVGEIWDAKVPVVYEVDAAGEAVSTISHSLYYTVGTSQIVIDNGIHSPNSAMNPESPLSDPEVNLNGSYLFVPSAGPPPGHLYAFSPKLIPKPPVISGEAFEVAGTSEAIVRGEVNPEGLATEYRFEYLTASAYQHNVEAAGAGHGFDGAASASGALPAGNEAVAVTATLPGLAQGTAYRFRLAAANGCEGEEQPACETEGEALGFSTYPGLTLSASCPNQALRLGPSSALPDCRAYELASPPDTGGQALEGPGTANVGEWFGTTTASPDGSTVSFTTRGGAIPGTEAAGSANGSTYLATRGGSGWGLTSTGMTGTQSSVPLPGGESPEHAYAVSSAAGTSPLVLEGKPTVYLRYPDGSFHLLGEGSLALEPRVRVRLLAPGGAHAIFNTTTEYGDPARQLEPDAPPGGTGAIYDRTPDGSLHVVSLLPGDITPAAGEDAGYLGTSAQGNAVAFTVGSSLTSPLYLRLDDAKTLEFAGPGATFAGLSADGRYAFYLAGGDLYRRDTRNEATVQITETGDVTVVNLPADGTSAYFVSASAIAAAGANPQGAAPLAGQENLYRWAEGGLAFVGTVTERDVEGEALGSTGSVGGLGLWVGALRGGTMGRDPSRATADGRTLVFESRADLTAYDPEGHAEVYRYDAGAGTLACLSCNPTGAAASADATLQSMNPTSGPPSPQPLGPNALLANLSTNGQRAFFETAEPLVPADSNGLRDVYEWEAQGEGSCTRAGGCVYLISSGQSARASYLFGASKSGGDVFIYTSDRLLGADTDEAPSIYDAREKGGFAEATPAASCQGEGCRPDLTPAPALSAPASPASGRSGNVRRCPRHKHRAKRKGRSVCVKNKKHRHKHRHKRRHARHSHKGKGKGKHKAHRGRRAGR